MDIPSKQTMTMESLMDNHYEDAVRKSNAIFEKGKVENSMDLIKYEKRDIRGDTMNFALLTFLYFIQGAVIGLMMAVPFILQKRKVSYKQQAIFHLSTYAVSFKILWVPILDSFFLKGEGRRKLVAITMQYLIGTFLLIVSMNVDYYLGTDDGSQKPDLPSVTVVFFLCSLFSSIQDVALDGWSLTIFQRKSKVYSASCRGIGTSLGLMIIFPSFLNLESTYFANLFRSVPGDTGFVDFEDFTRFLSAMFIITTTLILKFKKEKQDEDIEIDLTKADTDRNKNIKETYVHLWKIMKLGSMKMMTFFLLTWHIGFGPVANVAPIKLLDYGVPRGKLSMFTVCGIPLLLGLPFLLQRYKIRPEPARIFFVAYILRLLNCVLLALLVYRMSCLNKYTDVKDGYWYFAPLIFMLSFDYIAVFAMIMAIVALFTRISDHQFGSAFMTLLISLNNIGSAWPSTACLWFMDLATISICTEGNGPKCRKIDGYFVQTGLCTLIGILWIWWAKKQLTRLEKVDVALVRNIA